MNREEKFLNELKAILVNYPEQRVDLEEDQKFTILEGDNEFEYEDSWEDYDEWCDHNWCGEDYTVNSIYINENDELSFDLTKNYSDCNGGDEEDLKNVTIDFICDESDCDLELQIGELMAFVNSHNVSNNGVAIIPEGTTEIGEWAFALCDSLKSVTIPESVTSIGDSAFIGCASLKSIVVAEGNPVYDSRECCNAIIETKTNTLICGCKSTIIPESVTVIGECAFNSCSLESITFLESVTEIGECAFNSCSLESITFLGSVTKIDECAFDDCTVLTAIYVPAKKADYYKERLPEELHDKIVELEAKKQAKAKK